MVSREELDKYMEQNRNVPEWKAREILASSSKSSSSTSSTSSSSSSSSSSKIEQIPESSPAVYRWATATEVKEAGLDPKTTNIWVRDYGQGNIDYLKVDVRGNNESVSNIPVSGGQRTIGSYSVEAKWSDAKLIGESPNILNEQIPSKQQQFNAYLKQGELLTGRSTIFTTPEQQMGYRLYQQTEQIRNIPVIGSIYSTSADVGNWVESGIKNTFQIKEWQYNDKYSPELNQILSHNTEQRFFRGALIGATADIIRIPSGVIASPLIFKEAVSDTGTFGSMVIGSISKDPWEFAGRTAGSYFTLGKISEQLSQSTATITAERPTRVFVMKQDGKISTLTYNARYKVENIFGSAEVGKVGTIEAVEGGKYIGTKFQQTFSSDLSLSTSGSRIYVGRAYSQSLAITDRLSYFGSIGKTSTLADDLVSQTARSYSSTGLSVLRRPIGTAYPSGSIAEYNVYSQVSGSTLGKIFPSRAYDYVQIYGEGFKQSTKTAEVISGSKVSIPSLTTAEKQIVLSKVSSLSSSALAQAPKQSALSLGTLSGTSALSSSFKDSSSAIAVLPTKPKELVLPKSDLGASLSKKVFVSTGTTFLTGSKQKITTNVPGITDTWKGETTRFTGGKNSNRIVLSNSQIFKDVQITSPNVKITYGTKEKINYRITSKINFVPTEFPKTFPTIGFGSSRIGRSGKLSLKGLSRTYKYLPSYSAKAFNIRASSMPKGVLNPIGIRPILGNKAKKRKKK